VSTENWWETVAGEKGEDFLYETTTKETGRTRSLTVDGTLKFNFPYRTFAIPE
jgi:hypothetical protein